MERTFIVSPATINCIVTLLHEASQLHTKSINAAIGNDVRTEAGANLLAQQMMNLNVRALDARYPDEMHSNQIVRFHVVRTSPVQALKAMKCWLYQCSEDGCYNEPIFLAIQDFMKRCSVNIIESLPEYEAAKWTL